MGMPLCIPSKAIRPHFSLQRMRYPIEKWAQRCNLLCNMPENHWRSEAAASLCQTESANGLRIGASGLTRVFLKFSRFGAVMPPRAIVRHGVPLAGRPGTIPLQASSPPAPVWLRSTLRRDASFAKLRCKKSVPHISFLKRTGCKACRRFGERPRRQMKMAGFPCGARRFQIGTKRRGGGRTPSSAPYLRAF